MSVSSSPCTSVFPQKMENGPSVTNPQERTLRRICMRTSPSTSSYRENLSSTLSTSSCHASSPVCWLYLSSTCLLEQVSTFDMFWHCAYTSLSRPEIGMKSTALIHCLMSWQEACVYYIEYSTRQGNLWRNLLIYYRLKECDLGKESTLSIFGLVWSDFRVMFHWDSRKCKFNRIDGQQLEHGEFFGAWTWIIYEITAIHQLHVYPQQTVKCNPSLSLTTYNRSQQGSIYHFPVVINSPNCPCCLQERRWRCPFPSSSHWLSSCFYWLTRSLRPLWASQLLSTTSCSPWFWSLSLSS